MIRVVNNLITTGALLKNLLLACSIIIAGFSTSLSAQKIERQKSPKGAKVYIVSPKNKATVGRKFKVIFGLTGMGVAPAGYKKENTGHHHLQIDGKSLPPMDSPMLTTVTHFGGGQTETMLELKPGKHTLRLILGDYIHVPHNPPVISEEITVYVK